MNSFCPKRWPEEPVPADEQGCQDCGLYKQGTRMVWGEGNPEAPIMIVLDNPGALEDKEGNPMLCGTRQTLQQAANEAGLEPNQLYVTYILKRRPVRAYDKDLTRAICMPHLIQQLERQCPSLVLCLGNVAVQSFFGNAEADVKGMRGSWYDVNGYATTVAYHPLAVRRRPNLYKQLVEDLTFVAKQLQKANEKESPL
ncbi:uracil-DNA glycosylase [Sporosarcina sp. Te-1]|uniref:uracil-DNA glycosylase n=1 Tax=Sporosarcina sp. Te-1 TaxID=2818390 RepID=UPI001A9F9254|nr:uracil-DNA glycosylase [Sporosarcina sp. Te-1]QTD40490.1 uracil-DNA glycosylase [Sporosarcina sp. Te-1]